LVKYDNSNIVADPSYSLFYSSSNCNLRNSLIKNSKLDPNIHFKWKTGSNVVSSLPYNQQQAQRIIAKQVLPGFKYPSKIQLNYDDCESRNRISPGTPNPPFVEIVDQTDNATGEVVKHRVKLQWFYGFDGGSFITSYKIYKQEPNAEPVQVGDIPANKCVNHYTLEVVEKSKIWVTASNCVPKERWTEPAASCTTLTSEKSNIIVPVILPVLEGIAVKQDDNTWVLRESLSILSSQILTIPANQVLVIPPGMQLTNQGAIIVFGSLRVNGNLTNNGSIFYETAVRQFEKNYSIDKNITITETGVLTNNKDCVIPNDAILVNNGIYQNNKQITIRGLFLNNGDLVNNSVIVTI
jgi:hypothetical protein